MEHNNIHLVLVNIYLVLQFLSTANAQLLEDSEIEFWLEDLSTKAAKEYGKTLRTVPHKFTYNEEMRLMHSLGFLITALERLWVILDHYISEFSGDTSTLACVKKNIQKTGVIIVNKLKRQLQKKTVVNWAEALSSALQIVGSDLIFKGLKDVKGNVQPAIMDISVAFFDVAVITRKLVSDAKLGSQTRGSHSKIDKHKKRQLKKLILCSKH